MEIELRIQNPHPLAKDARGVGHPEHIVFLGTKMMHESHQRSRLQILLLLLLVPMCAAQRVAITFDDLPLNGDLPAGVTRAQITRDTLAVLKMRQAPATYGFVNGKKLEGNADAAEALKLWAASEPVGSHTYSHMDLNANLVEAFEREIEEDEPVLELVAPEGCELALAALSLFTRG